MNYKEQMEKIAKARWKKHLDGLQSEDDIWDYVSDLTRNRPGGWNHPGNYANREELGSNKKEIKRLLSSEKGLGRGGIAANVERAKNKSYRDLTPGELGIRKALMDDVKMDKLSNKSILNNPDKRKSMGILTKLDETVGPDDYVDIINGTNKSRALGFLRGGNGHTNLQGKAYLHDGTIQNKGLQVHSLVKDRAPLYAKKQAENTGGSPAILTGKIKRKYLFPNPSTGSGFGDEYGIPSQYFNKIKNAKVTNPETGKVYESVKDLSERLPFGLSKTPGSPNIAKKLDKINEFKKTLKGINKII